MNTIDFLTSDYRPSIDPYESAIIDSFNFDDDPDTVLIDGLNSLDWHFDKSVLVYYNGDYIGYAEKLYQDDCEYYSIVYKNGDGMYFA